MGRGGSSRSGASSATTRRRVVLPRRAYTSGQCHALALALHEATGWPIVGAEDEKLDVCHLLVRCPDGRLLDITGAHAADEVLELEHMAFCPGPEYLVERDPRWVASLGLSPDWREPDLETARSFVAPLLRSCGLDAEGRAGRPVPPPSRADERDLLAGDLRLLAMGPEVNKALVEEMKDEWVSVTLADGDEPRVSYGEGVKRDSELLPAAEMFLRVVRSGKPTPDLCNWDPEARGTAMLTLERVRDEARVEAACNPEVDLERGAYSEAQALAISAAHALAAS